MPRAAIETSKKLSALRQIRAAMGHFHLKQFECAITLAGAAEGQSETNALDHAFNVLKRKLIIFLGQIARHVDGSPQQSSMHEYCF
jgi:hypothetical protein